MKRAKTKKGRYVWRWYVDNCEGWVGPYRSKRAAAEYAHSLTEKGDDFIEIARWKTSTVDLSEAIDDAFVEEMLRSLIMVSDLDGIYETPPELAEFCTNPKKQKDDFFRRLKAAVEAWQKVNNIVVPSSVLIVSKNNCFIRPRRKKTSNMVPKE